MPLRCVKYVDLGSTFPRPAVRISYLQTLSCYRIAFEDEDIGENGRKGRRQSCVAAGDIGCKE